MDKARLNNGMHGIIALVKCYGEEMELTKDELADIWYLIGAVDVFGVNLDVNLKSFTKFDVASSSVVLNPNKFIFVTVSFKKFPNAFINT